MCLPNSLLGLCPKASTPEQTLVKNHPSVVEHGTEPQFLTRTSKGLHAEESGPFGAQIPAFVSFTLRTSTRNWAGNKQADRRNGAILG